MAKKGRGGKRKGAGRPQKYAEGPVQSVGLSLPEGLIGLAQVAADEAGIPLSELFTDAVRREVKRRAGDR